MDLDSTQSSRMRLLSAAKTLFARNGYEQTSTSAIARAAGTSESQLIRYFTGKAGLLQTIFEESWTPLLGEIQRIMAASPNVSEALLEVLSLMMDAFGRDHDLAFLILFEGRRIRGGTHDVQLSDGYLKFAALLESLIARGAEDGTFPEGINRTAVVAALVGCAEGMTREAIIAERAGRGASFSAADIRAVFRSILDGLSNGAVKSK